LEQRLLPAFEGLEAEATKVQHDTYEELARSPVSPEIDPSVPAELAFDAGLDHYAGVSAVRQALMNAFAPIFFHAWEQQLLSFHRREVLSPLEEHMHQFLNVGELQKRLKAEGLDITSLKSWPVIQELRLVANTVKHADGTSATQLRVARPDLFVDPVVTDLGFPELLGKRQVYAPLSGEDLFLSTEDLRKYSQALIDFWEEFADALARH
jgi:hypothetical protein